MSLDAASLGASRSQWVPQDAQAAKAAQGGPRRHQERLLLERAVVAMEAALCTGQLCSAQSKWDRKLSTVLTSQHDITNPTRRDVTSHHIKSHHIT